MTTHTFEFFRAGTHKSASGEVLTFTPDDLNRMVLAYTPDRRAAPLVYGHPNDDMPVMGTVRSLTVKGDRLYATAWFSDDLVKQVKAKRFKGVSAKFYGPEQFSNPQPGAWYLRHIGFLETVGPAVKGMDPVAFAGYDRDGAPVIPVATLEAAFSAPGSTGMEAMFSELPPEGEDPERERQVHDRMAKCLMAGDPSLTYRDAAFSAHQAIRAHRESAVQAQQCDPGRLAIDRAARQLMGEESGLSYHGAVQAVMRRQASGAAFGGWRD